MGPVRTSDLSGKDFSSFEGKLGGGPEKKVDPDAMDGEEAILEPVETSDLSDKALSSSTATTTVVAATMRMNRMRANMLV
jgi:hypothetical protein